MRIGIFPGTFDPIHLGHISFAVHTAELRNLDTVYLLPEVQPRGKFNVTPLAKRAEMLKEIISPYSTLRVLLSPFPQSSTINTLPWLESQFPQSSFTLLIGSDVAEHLNRWEDINSLAKRVSFTIGMREGADQGQLIRVMQQIESDHALTFEYTFITTAHAHLASSIIRATL